MRILLLGARGQLGSDIVRANSRRPRPFEVEEMDQAEVDVTDFEALERVLSKSSFEVLVNCTSYHKTDEVEGNASLGFATNCHAVARMARCCRESGARLVHISTDYVFGGGGQERPLREEDPTSPVNVYGASKAMGETLLRLEHDDHLILRVASLFGVAGAMGKGGNFVETMIRLGRERDELTVVDDQHMSPTATADVAEMILALIENPGPAGTYHAVNSGQASWHEFAEAILEGAGISTPVRPIPSSEFPTAARRPAYSVLDNAKLAGLIGAPRHWRAALGDYLVAKGHATGRGGEER